MQFREHSLLTSMARYDSGRVSYENERFRTFFEHFRRCGLSLLLGLAVLRGFFSGFSGFRPSTKTSISKFQVDHDRGRARLMWRLMWLPLNCNLFVFYTDSFLYSILSTRMLINETQRTSFTLLLTRWRHRITSVGGPK